MRAKSKLLALALTAALQPALAGVVSLNFEDINANVSPDGTGMVQLLDRYQGLGVQFLGDAWGVTSLRCDGLSGFVPHDNGCAALQLAGDPRDNTVEAGKTFTLNFASGFVAGSSFFFSALGGSNVSITLYDEVDGKGRSIPLGGLPTADCTIPGARFCVWNQLNFDFGGIARSMVVTGNDETLMLDDIRLVQAASAPGNLPEPGSIALAVGALGALGWARRRAAR